ncbi:hypothetical protein AwErysi_05650 [Erysipelotrichaceae bacterium]|nr:hypothetical protein AwErysi_05650 [Erysipelotrichaceae bacterium]
MVVIRPFKAIRPSADKVQEVASLPYDVINSKEAAKLTANNPYSFLHIDKSEVDLAEDISPYDESVYAKAKANLAAFLEKGWFIQDKEPQLYVYELTMAGRSQTGLVTCTSSDDYLTGKIKKHEFTREEKEIDRIRHVDTCDANTSPIFLTYKGQKAIDTIMTKTMEQAQILYDFTSFHDVRHRIWPLKDPTDIHEITELFANDVDALYIADGHHRTESAVKVGLKRRKSNPNATADAEFNYFLSVLFPANELAILDYNRVISAPLPEQFMEQLGQAFELEVSDLGQYKPQNPGEIGMYLHSSWYKLTIKPEVIPNDEVGSLDVSILQKEVLEKIFDIQDIRTDNRIDFVGGIRGLGELEKCVDSGGFTVAFAMYPTTVEQLLAVADANLIMPPKSTWFEPKLLSGLFVHDLESK